MNVLVLTRFYTPAYRAGGPVRTLTNMAELLGEEFHFHVLTTNCDVGTRDPLPVEPNRWHRVGKAEVCYLSPDRCTLPGIGKAIRSIDYDILYANSYFCPLLTTYPLILRRFGRIPLRPTIVAPRGTFARGATSVGSSLKHVKKWSYQRFANLLRLYDDVLWQASSDFEAEDIRRMYSRGPVHVAPNLAAEITAEVSERRKEPGRASFVFLARVAPVKNLAFAIQTIGKLQGEVCFDLYGPKEDAAYWAACQEQMGRLPSNVRVEYHGAVGRNDVSRALSSSDFFYMPTLGENFGHSIVEAMAHGLPVIISDRTPWRNLEAGRVGWDLPLEAPEAFVCVLQRCVDMGAEEYGQFAAGAHRFAQSQVNSREIVEQNRELFFRAYAMGNGVSGP